MLNNSHNKDEILSDTLKGTHEFNSVHNEVQDDLERINKMFAFVNALCDVFIDDKGIEINKWANSKVNEHTKKINNLFLL
ncbi:MAG: hypothetical protein H0W73_10650 [Bacteroidetes bacterium]|nr:hypothetical protein [Bacteroidota bacterium]